MVDEQAESRSLIDNYHIATWCENTAGGQMNKFICRTLVMCTANKFLKKQIIHFTSSHIIKGYT